MCASAPDLRVQVHLPVDRSRHQIKQGNDVAGEVFELLVELLVELVQVVAVDFEGGLFELLQFFELCEVEWLLGLLLLVTAVRIFGQLNESVDERFEFDLGLVGTDVSAPDDLGVLG